MRHSREQQTLPIIYDSFSFQKNQVKSTVRSPPTKFNLNSSTTEKSNLYIANSVAISFPNAG